MYLGLCILKLYRQKNFELLDLCLCSDRPREAGSQQHKAISENAVHTHKNEKKNEEGTGMNLDLIFYYEYFESNFMSTDTRISLHAILLKDERNRNIRGE